MKIYTRTGDKGTTALFNGSRVPKSHLLVDAYGTVDECNAAIGMATSHLTYGVSSSSSSSTPEASSPPVNADDLTTLVDRLEAVQRYLFDVGAHLATPKTTSSQSKIKRTEFPADAVTQLEEWIDDMDSKLQPLTTFILPGGHPAAAALHLARTIARRAERRVTPLFVAEEADVNGSDGTTTTSEQPETAERDIDPTAYQFLNRLSDFLFTASRCANHIVGVPDVKWRQT